MIHNTKTCSLAWHQPKWSICRDILWSCYLYAYDLYGYYHILWYSHKTSWRFDLTFISKPFFGKFVVRSSCAKQQSWTVWPSLYICCCCRNLYVPSHWVEYIMHWFIGPNCKNETFISAFSASGFCSAQTIYISYIKTFFISGLTSVTKFRHFGSNFLKALANFQNLYLVFGKILNLFWQKLILGNFFIVVNGQISNNNLHVWSHWWWPNLCDSECIGVCKMSHLWKILYLLKWQDTGHINELFFNKNCTGSPQ